MTSTSKEVPTSSSSSVYAFPSQDGDAAKESFIPSHHRRNSTPISAVSVSDKDLLGRLLSSTE